MKCSLDFDSTLSRSDVQTIAKDLINCGHEVWCITSRYHENQPPRYKIKGIFIEHDNSDIFKVCAEVGIKKDHIYFTNCKDKVNFIKNNGFLFHLDDDWHECSLINEYTNCRGIWCFGKNNFKLQIQKICKEI